VLDLVVNKYQGSVVRITLGTGAGQEDTIASNTATIVTIVTPWLTEPDATSFFEIAESSWRPGATGSTSPITIDVPERIGAGVEISARAANVSDEQAAYGLSPLTSWVLGQSGEIVADSGVPPAPVFGLVLSPTQGGVLELGEIAFGTLLNTTSIIAGTYTFHYYDEVNGAAPLSLTTAIGATDSSVPFGTTFAAGALVQIEQEILQITATNTDGSSAVTRGVHNTTAATHAVPVLVYILNQTAVIYPFIKSFFGSPASGDWRNSVTLPNVRLASVELYMTNALGDGAVTANSYTGTIDSGLRTMAGGQFSFQISGYLAVQTVAAPIVIVDADRSVRDIYGIVTTPSAGASITLQLNRNGAAYVTVQFAAGATVSGVVGGFGLPALRAQDQLSLDVDGVGTTIPGSNLNLILRL